MLGRKKKRPSVNIGIDPAFRKNGFGVCFHDLTDNTMSFEMYGSFIDFVYFLMSDDAPSEARCIIENSNMQNSSFDIRGNKPEVARKGRNVGTNQAVSQLTVDLCRRKYGKNNVREVSPKQKGSKWNATYFKRIIASLGITLVTTSNNQDFRDAAKLALMKVF